MGLRLGQAVAGKEDALASCLGRPKAPLVAAACGEEAPRTGDTDELKAVAHWLHWS